MNKVTKELIRRIPKAENHVHLEGAIPIDLILRFGERNKVDLPFFTVEEAKKYIVKSAQSLEDFIVSSNLIGSVIQTEEDFYELVIAFARNARRQNIIYSETMISYAVHEKKGITVESVFDGLTAGREVAYEKYGVDIQFIAELDRAKGEEWSEEFVRKMKCYKDSAPIVAIGWELGIEGKEENNYSAKEHIEVFKLAKEYGFGTTAHCGEMQGPNSVWDAINYLKVDRIDHGVQSIKDKNLVGHLANAGTLLTVCPASNVQAHIYPSLEAHPLKEFIVAGVNVSVNSDDPTYIQIGSDDVYHGLVDELIGVAEKNHFSDETIIGLVRNSFEYSFAGEKYLDLLDAFVDNWDRK